MSVDSLAMDTTRRFVRICGERGNGFIEFEFAIGEAEIFVEMILTREALTEFCAANRVEILPPRDPDAPQGDWDWRLADATHTRFRQSQ